MEIGYGRCINEFLENSRRKNQDIIGDGERIWGAVKEKYLRPDMHIGYSICDAINFSLASGINIADSWMWIGDFIKNNTVILFFNKDLGDNFYEIENG